MKYNQRHFSIFSRSKIKKRLSGLLSQFLYYKERDYVFKRHLNHFFVSSFLNLHQVKICFSFFLKYLLYTLRLSGLSQAYLK